MADPVTLGLAGISAGTTIAGAFTGAAGASESAAAQANAYQYKAGVAKINQQIELQNADYERAAGTVLGQESGMKTRAQIGQTKVIQGAGNLDVNTGSPLAVRQSERDIGNQDQTIIASNTARRAYGYEIKAVGEGTDAVLDTMGAEQAKKAGQIGVTSSILSGVSSVASKWMQAKQSGMLGSSGDNAGYYGGSPETNPNLVAID